MKLVICITYLVVALITARTVLTFIYRAEKDIDVNDMFAAGVAAAFWPIVVVCGLLWLTGRYVLKPIVMPTAMRRDARTLARQKAEEAARVRANDLKLPYPSPPEGSSIGD